MVEYFLAKENVAGSTPVVRYKNSNHPPLGLREQVKPIGSKLPFQYV